VPEQTLWRINGSLSQSSAGFGFFEPELEPGEPRHFHLGTKSKQVRAFNRLNSPEIEGITLDQRKARSRVCIKYGVRSFPSVVLIAPDGASIATQSGYQGQAAESWVAALETRLPAQSVAAAGQVHSSLGEAVVTARDAKRPILVMVSRPGDARATTRVASLLQDPEFESLARDNFVVAQVPPTGAVADPADDEAMGQLLGDGELPPEAVEIVVTDDGRTPLFMESGELEPKVVVTGLRRFLATRQAARTTRR
jgi:hypothetical protein